MVTRVLCADEQVIKVRLPLDEGWNELPVDLCVYSSEDSIREEDSMVTQDGTGKSYVQVETGGSEFVRLTYVGGEAAGYSEDSVRIQIQDSNGHLRPGPEIPVRVLPRVTTELFELLIGR